MNIPPAAWTAAYPSTPFPLPLPTPMGGLEVRLFHPSGGCALIDLFAMQAMAKVRFELVDTEAELEEQCRRAWELAAAMVRTRPEMPEPPRSTDNGKGPRLLTPGGRR